MRLGRGLKLFRFSPRALRWAILGSFLLSSCQGRWGRRGSKELAVSADSQYAATQMVENVSFEDVAVPPAPAMMMTDEPLRLRNRRDLDPWDLSLQETLFIALSNAEIIRQNGQFLNPNNALLRSPDSIVSTMDPAIQQSGVLFGQRGVEAALSDFDAQFTTRMVWGRNAQIQNNPFTAGGIPAGQTLTEETGQFQSSFQKRFATGGQASVSHNWNYSGSNAQGRLFPSVYEGNIRTEFRQPLLAGGGVEFTRIAGPVSDNIQGVTGVQQGVVICRINGEIAVTDFEINVTTFLRDVELQYWRLYIAYRTIDSELEALRSARETLQVTQSRADAQAPGGGSGRLVESRDAVLQSEQRSREALNNLYSSEAELRLLLGLQVSDGRFIRPVDGPITADLTPDWDLQLGTALTRRPELRRQKWSVKSTELQLVAAENLARPRFDFVASSQTNGFGNDLLGPSDAPGTNRPLGNAYERLLGFQETGWNLGFEYSSPIGLRFAHTQVRNQELRLAKAMKLLKAQETEISHEVAAAFRDIDRTALSVRNQYALVENSRIRLEVAEQEYEANREGTAFLTLDALNRARDALTQSEIQYARSQVEYTMAITDLYYRTGRLMEYDSVILSEGPGCVRMTSDDFVSQ
jgi:outer membrane protein TolC